MYNKIPLSSDSIKNCICNTKYFDTMKYPIIKKKTYFRSCKISRALCIDIKEDCPAGIIIMGVLDILCFAC